MFEEIFYNILFFAIPTIIIAFLGVNIYRYLSAKRKNKLSPGAFSPEEMIRRKGWLVVSAVIAGTLVIVVVGVVALLYIAIAFM